MAKPPSDDELDRFMRSEVQEGRRVRAVRPHRFLLTTAVIVALVWLCWPTRDELLYHFSEQSLTDLGDAAGIPQDKPLPTNWYVRLSGVLGNKAATISGVFRPGSYRQGPVQVRQLLGSNIFLEFDQETFLERYGHFIEDGHSAMEVTVEGRLADLGPSSEIAPVRDYFEQRFGMKLPPDARVLVVGEVPGALWRYPLVVAGCALVAFMSLFFLLRSFRTYVVEPGPEREA